ncbi:unnamed protein product [Rotaria sp. Silwood2]|nr:unnamed protein product [Rotaria sp. Silwood2]
MNDDNRHAFVLAAYDNTSHYFRFSFENFSSASSSNEFGVMIDRDGKQNIFSSQTVIVDVEPKDEDDATERLKLNLTLTSHVPLPDLSWIAPGTMGPLSWIPILQCYHHVLSMRHDIHGSIKIGDYEQTNISGVGYTEKDWGSSFPSAWIWGQTNQWMNATSASLFFSFASVPWYFELELPGFLIVFEYNHQFYRFNTYLLSIIHDFSVNNSKKHISFTVYDILFQYKLVVTIDLTDANDALLLYGPRHGRMEKFVKEFLSDSILFDVQLSQLIYTNTNDRLIQKSYIESIVFEARAQHVAFEMNGDIHNLIEKCHLIYDHLYSWLFPFNRTFIKHFKMLIMALLMVSAFIFYRRSKSVVIK